MRVPGVACAGRLGWAAITGQALADPMAAPSQSVSEGGRIASPLYVIVCA